MDLKTIKKPFHIVCPHCGKEVELWANDIEKRYQKAKQELHDIKFQIDMFNSDYHKDYKTNEWFKNAKKAYNHKTKEVAMLKQTRKMLMDEAEKQRERAFLDVVKRSVSHETFMKWITEAEDDIQFSTYDMAKQKSSQILGSPPKV